MGEAGRMSRLRKALLVLSLLFGLLLAFALLTCTLFRPVVLVRTSNFREVPEVNNPAFRHELAQILTENDEPNVTMGRWVFVLRSLARDSEMASKYTQMALARSGQEDLLFGEDEDVMASDRRKSVAELFMELEKKELEKGKATQGKTR